MTRKKTLKLLAFCIAVVLFGLQVRGQTVAELRQILDNLNAYPDLIVFNGKIATMDAEMTTVQAMAVRDRRILALGANDEIRKLAGPDTEMMDAKGRTVLPGLIDSHTHPHLWGIKHFGPLYDPQFKVSYLMGASADDVIRQLEPTIKKRAGELGPDKWIIVHFPRSLREDIAPRITRADLDRMAPANPVFWVSGLGGITNTKGKEVFETYPTIGKDLVFLRIWYFLPQVIFKGNLDVIAEWLKRELIECNARWGITTVAAHIEPQDIIRALNRMDRKGELPIRFAWVHRTAFTLGKDPAEFYKLYGDIRGQGSEYFWNMGVGEEGWDKSFCTTAIAKTVEARAQDDLSTCRTKESQDYLSHLAALKAGLRIAHLHSMRDGGVDAIIDLVEDAMRAGVTLEQIKEAKIGMDHTAWVRPDQIPKLVRYGIWVNPQTVYLLSYARQMVENYDYELYQKWLMPVKSIVESGAPLVLSTDAHVSRTEDDIKYEASMLEWPWGNSVWPFLSSFVTRDIGGRVWNPAERLDRITVLKGFTTWAAEYVLREKELGSLETGKLADFIVIDKDYFTIPENDLGKIETLLTAVGGNIVYRSSEF